MNLQEFNDEFRFKYDAASSGGPDLNSYEKSLCLTQACKDMIVEAYMSYESSEISRRILAPLLKEHNSVITPIIDDMTNFKSYLVSIPQDLNYVLREEAKQLNCGFNPKIEITDLDNLSNFLRSPFKRPNKRKIIKVENSDTNFKIYTKDDLSKYKIKYIKKSLPIILEDFVSDPELSGTETIEGLNTQTTTELPFFVHDKIIDRAVIIAIKATRENSLQTNVQLQ